MRTNKIQFLSVLCAVFFAMAIAPGRAETAWQVINIEGRDYLSLNNVADFYHLKNVSPEGDQHVVLSDSRPRLETLANPREIDLNGVKEWLSFPILYRDGQALISRFDLSKTVEPSLRPTMIANLKPFQTVVLDAGHGGQDGGGRTMTGSEKDYTLDVISGLRQSLEAKGLQVVLTRSDDQYLALEERAALTNSVPNAVFVSVHFNSGDSSASGLEVYAMTPRGASSTSDSKVTADQFEQMPGNDFDSASLALANCTHHALLGNMSTSDRGVKRARFAVLRLIHAPAILIEGGFMTNGPESREITDPVWRQKLAESIAIGVRDYRDLAQFKQAPKLLADYCADQWAPASSVAYSTSFALRGYSRNLELMPISNSRNRAGQKPTIPASRMR